MPKFERFVDTENVALVMTDAGTYLNLGEEYKVEHHMVEHNQRFVNGERIPH